MSDCDRVRDLVVLLDDELDASEAEALAVHLGCCPECRAARAEFLKLRGRLCVGAIPPAPARPRTVQSPRRWRACRVHRSARSARWA